MSIYIELICCRCARHCDGYGYNQRYSYTRRLRKTAKAGGWQFIEGRDLCPECVRAHPAGMPLDEWLTHWEVYDAQKVAASE